MKINIPDGFVDRLLPLSLLIGGGILTLAAMLNSGDKADACFQLILGLGLMCLGLWDVRSKTLALRHELLVLKLDRLALLLGGQPEKKPDGKARAAAAVAAGFQPCGDPECAGCAALSGIEADMQKLMEEVDRKMKSQNQKKKE